MMSVSESTSNQSVKVVEEKTASAFTLCERRNNRYSVVNLLLAHRHCGFMCLLLGCTLLNKRRETL